MKRETYRHASIECHLGSSSAPMTASAWHAASEAMISSVELQSSPSSLRVLACSASSSNQRMQAQLLATRTLGGNGGNGGNGSNGGSYKRRGFLDHFKTRPLITSTLRVATQQSALVMSNYMSDQQEEETKRNEMVDRGELTEYEAESQATEWENEEWKKRWSVFPTRFFTALAKYHVITLLMRCYEYTAEHLLKCDDGQLCRLTLDIFPESKKIARSSEGEYSEILNRMFSANFSANLISYLADYSVHQVMLCFGYYMYIRKKRQQANQRRLEQQQDSEEEVIMDGPLFLSFINKSCRLASTRALGCVCYSAGAAVGTLVSPGWGTLFVANMGEGFSTVLLEEPGNAPSA